MGSRRARPRGGRWAARCPIRAGDVQTRKERSHRKPRMDQRTRERLPAIPALATALDQARAAAAALLADARDAVPGERFTAAGQTMRRPVLTTQTQRVWADDDAGARRGRVNPNPFQSATATRRDLTREEDNALGLTRPNVPTKNEACVKPATLQFPTTYCGGARSSGWPPAAPSPI